MFLIKKELIVSGMHQLSDRNLIALASEDLKERNYNFKILFEHDDAF